MDEDTLARAYARLNALKSQLDGMVGRRSVAGAEFIDEYHGAITQLEACGYGLDEFRIKPTEIRTGPRGYVDLRVLLMKANGVLTYFSIINAPGEPPKPRIGFAGPRSA